MCKATAHYNCFTYFPVVQLMIMDSDVDICLFIEEEIVSWLKSVYESGESSLRVTDIGKKIVLPLNVSSTTDALLW